MSTTTTTTNNTNFISYIIIHWVIIDMQHYILTVCILCANN